MKDRDAVMRSLSPTPKFEGIQVNIRLMTEILLDIRDQNEQILIAMGRSKSFFTRQAAADLGETGFKQAILNLKPKSEEPTGEEVL